MFDTVYGDGFARMREEAVVCKGVEHGTGGADCKGREYIFGSIAIEKHRGQNGGKGAYSHWAQPGATRGMNLELRQAQRPPVQ